MAVALAARVCCRCYSARSDSRAAEFPSRRASSRRQLRNQWAGSREKPHLHSSFSCRLLDGHPFTRRLASSSHNGDGDASQISDDCTSLINLVSCAILAVLLTFFIQLLLVCMWRHIINRRYYKMAKSVTRIASPTHRSLALKCRSRRSFTRSRNHSCGRHRSSSRAVYSSPALRGHLSRFWLVFQHMQRRVSFWAASPRLPVLLWRWPLCP